MVKVARDVDDRRLWRRCLLCDAEPSGLFNRDGVVACGACLGVSECLSCRRVYAGDGGFCSAACLGEYTRRA